MIAIPVYVREQKNYELLRKCVNSIDWADSIAFYVNGSNYDLNDYEDEHVFITHRDKNSVAGAWNDAVSDAYKLQEHCIIMNQDVEVNKDIIETLLTSLRIGDSGIYAARTQDNQPDFALFAVNPQWIKETFGTLRPFDEGYEGAYFEDNDFRYQCKLKGIEIPTIELDFKHYGSSVVKLDLEAQKENEQRFRKNHLRYINKWGGIRGGETYKTPFNK